ncbi:HIRA-interacting protein 3 isoform X2 [Octodon degus]|uniref:HIRA-interacting protein 3 isoform X2 n=1 Tax=Octodon degus TaxID=10160 RepID=A0A6P6EWD7_OCTDE|nr:HIRA-interacting protein 3 isoform X2 [Octodon degus]
MARENEMREFTHSFFRGRPDLSTLTHSIVRRKFLAHAGRNHLEPEEKQALKRLVEEELLKVDEAGTRRKKLDLTKKTKRPPTPCSDQERKRFRLNSESGSRSSVSSPDCFGCPADNRMAEAETSRVKEERPRQASKKVVESSDEEQQSDQPAKQPAKMGLEESSEEEQEEAGEGSGRVNKILEEKDSEEDEEENEIKGRTLKKRRTKNEQARGKASARKHQARDESEDSEEVPVQRRAKKSGEKTEAKSHEESEKESEEECLLKKEENEEDWRKPGARSKGREPSALEGRRLRDGDSGEEEEKEAAGSGDNSGGGKESPGHRKSKVRSQWKSRKRQNRSSEDEDSCEAQAAAKSAKLGSVSGEESDLERELSDSEAGASPKGARRNRSAKKSSQKSRARTSSSSSDASPQPKDRKASSGRHGEDHPAVTRLKRYIRACGAHRNYKKLLGSCRSHKERLSVLRAELEALGMKGNPSLEKCRALKEQREAEAEAASLDVANIISSSGRPRRRTAWNPSGEAPPFGELYHRTLDSEDEQPRQAPPDWSHMRGIISSDGESN